MKYRCQNCCHKVIGGDDTGHFPICVLKYHKGIEAAKAECLKPGVCPHYMTRTEAEKCNCKERK